MDMYVRVRVCVCVCACVFVFKNTWLPSEGEAGRCYFGGSHCIVIMSSSESGFALQEGCCALRPMMTTV